MFVVLPAVLGGLAVKTFMDQRYHSANSQSLTEVAKKDSDNSDISKIQDKLDRLVATIEQQKKQNLTLEKRIRQHADYQRQLDKLVSKLSDMSEHGKVEKNFCWYHIAAVHQKRIL